MATIKVNLKSSERIYINGASLRVDRKVTLELENEAVFLLDSYVLAETEAVTPLRRLYLIVQTMLTAPASAPAAREVFDGMLRQLFASCADPSIRTGLAAVEASLDTGRRFEALKTLRGLFHIEDELARAVSTLDAV